MKKEEISDEKAKEIKEKAELLERGMVEAGLKQPDLTGEFDLAKSKLVVGQLYPVLKDHKGRIIDGFHRTEADPEWRTETKEQIKTDLDYILAKIHANWHRRKVKFEERQSDVTRLAELLKANGIARDKMVSTIVELTGFQDRWIRVLLPDEMKREYKISDEELAKQQARAEIIRCNLENMLTELLRGIRRVRPDDLKCAECPAKDVCSQAMGIKLEIKEEVKKEEGKKE